MPPPTPTTRVRLKPGAVTMPLDAQGMATAVTWAHKPAQARLIVQDSDLFSRRGFTDHEHLDEVEFIHMNGRVYDYNLGRFMSVDL